MHETVLELANAQSKDALKRIMINYFANEGISSLAFTLYKNHTKTGAQITYDWVSSELKPWHQYYLEQKYADIDRTLEFSEYSAIPVFWDVNQQLHKAKNSRERRIRQESIDFGIDKGLSIPFNSRYGDFGVLVLHQRFNQNGLDSWEEKQYLWMSLTQYYFHYLRIFLLSNSETKQVRLTRREQQCLELTSKGVRIEMISSSLGISERTCHFHLQNANKKLGVTNKYLAVTRWMQGV